LGTALAAAALAQAAPLRVLRCERIPELLSGCDEDGRQLLMSQQPPEPYLPLRALLRAVGPGLRELDISWCQLGVPAASLRGLPRGVHALRAAVMNVEDGCGAWHEVHASAQLSWLPYAALGACWRVPSPWRRGCGGWCLTGTR
jgi:hypothetical protein